LRKRRQYRIEHSVGLLVNLAVGGPDDAIALAAKKVLARPVAGQLLLGRMGCAVDFQNEASLAASEVGVVRTYALLTHELVSAKLAVA